MDERLALKYRFRDELTDAVIAELVGPSATDEIIPDPPITHYVAGILHPTSPEPDQVPVDAWGLGRVGPDDEGDEDATALANSRYPSSVGLTFAVEGDLTSALRIELSAAVYTDTGAGWQRLPLVIQPTELIPGNRLQGDRTLVAPGLELFSRVRPADAAGRVSITLALINIHRTDGDRRGRDSHAFLQPVIRVLLPDDLSLRFVDRSELARDIDDADIAAGRLLFRHVRNLAVGHGCGVRWDDTEHASWLATTFVPTYDLLLSDSNPAIDSWVLDMRAPARESRTAIVTGLQQLVIDYRTWIDDRAAEVDALAPDLRAQAETHLQECRNAADRMDAGVVTLADPEDDTPYRAFVLMSEAMVEQRIRSERVLAGRTDKQPEEIAAVWRPFQLAFILLCLKGLADETSKDREVADLLWFPTGGGKTEAYLGLVAFTVFLRRLRRRPDGVVALMRYTLRLLTAQQFERAALLMCCCEVIRRRRGDLGDKWIEVGLFVGRAAAPNKVKSAKKALDVLMANPGADTSRTGNPMQVRVCVWCGTHLGVEDHKIYKSPDRCVVECPNPECDFHSRLPWWVVDEDLYRERPAFVIGTVDKLANLAWRESSGTLFNRGDGQSPGLDLIIQDELHLISGPLGTVTGLYETAIDLLATSSAGIRPKVIASTATIRRAAEQVRAVFDREVAQFPPPALDSRNSYFAVEAPAEERGSRRYVGLMAPGTSQSTLLVRTYARLLHEATLGDYDDGVRDTYWTLVGYFNSLRVLAGAHLQILDDVNDRLAVIGNGVSQRTPDDHIVELNSRATSAEIALYLRQLRHQVGSPDCVDVVLATNMISVGVDVDRLGLMAVMGQPQATAEYIQATSRVGRRDPGLVFTLYNAARSRDRSHYEGFLPYHSTLYRQVEATSATPFSPRARDRALHAVLVALVRHTIPAMRGNAQAADVGAHLTEVNELVERIVERAEHIDKAEAPAVKEELELFLNRWRDRGSGDEPLSYENTDHPEHALLIGADKVLGGVMDGNAEPTLWSMRDVDRVTQLYKIGEV